MSDFTVAMRMKDGKKHWGVVQNAASFEEARTCVMQSEPKIATVLVCVGGRAEPKLERKDVA